MTKFILHGGYTRDNNGDNKKFFEEITKNAKKILCIYFAKKDNWKSYFEEDKPIFNFKNLVLANEEDIIKQIKEVDTVYIRGGDTELLKERLSKINFKKLIKGKTVVGSSAGAYVLSKCYYSNYKHKIGEGFGILNIKVFCHYNYGERENLEKLKQHNEKLETVVIPDYKYVVLEL